MKHARYALIAVALAAAGCGTLGKKIKSGIADRIDLGDGTVLGIVPMSAVEAAANVAQPGSGAYVAKVEAALASKREAKLGPFGGLGYTRQRQVVLKDGTVIPDSQIEKIIEILTPTVPAPIVRVVEPAQFATVPVVAQPAQTSLVQAVRGALGDAVGAATGAASGGLIPLDNKPDADAGALLEQIGNLKK